jgi:hypothetical protein
MAGLPRRRLSGRSARKFSLLMFKHTRSVTIAALCSIAIGCTDQGRKDVVRAIARHATSRFKVDRGFHVVDGQPVYLDSNASEGKITRQIPNVHPATFRALPRVGDERVFYAADDKRAYIAMHYNVTELPAADGGSFQLFPRSYTFGRDKSSVFYLGVAIKGADPESFVVLSDCFAKDASRAYLGTKPIPVHDISTWAPLSDGMAEDPWYRSSGDTHPRPSTELVAFGWSKDNSTVYWGCDAIEGSDPSQFIAMSKFYGKDNTQVYYAGDPIIGADAPSFAVVVPEPVGPKPDATDNHRNYKYGKPL